MKNNKKKTAVIQNIGPRNTLFQISFLCFSSIYLVARQTGSPIWPFFLVGCDYSTVLRAINNQLGSCLQIVTAWSSKWKEAEVSAKNKKLINCEICHSMVKCEFSGS